MSGNLVVLVTGANRGLGKETARQLAHRGITVVLGSRSLDRGTAAAAELAGSGATAVPILLDVTNPTCLDAAAEQVRRDHGRLDGLVNNAGIFVGAPATETTASDLRSQFETNVFGVVTVLGAFLQLLRAARAPRIVNVSSTTASLTLTSETRGESNMNLKPEGLDGCG